MSAETGTRPPFVVTPGPHLRTSESTAAIMWWVNAALMPTAVWGVWVFGPPALEVILGTVAGAVGAEALANRLMKRRLTVKDGSAVCTGLLLALTLPPLVPWWAALIGGVFAILLGKMIFGGLGYNLFNPAMIGRAFMMASFPVAMTIGWSIPRAWYSRLEAITTATPLGVMREHDLQAALQLIGGPRAGSGCSSACGPARSARSRWSSSRSGRWCCWPEASSGCTRRSASSSAWRS